jgi:hypothetical protein
MEYIFFLILVPATRHAARVGMERTAWTLGALEPKAWKLAS